MCMLGAVVGALLGIATVLLFCFLLYANHQRPQPQNAAALNRNHEEVPNAAGSDTIAYGFQVSTVLVFGLQ